MYFQCIILKKAFYGLSDNLILNKTKNIITREQGVKKLKLRSHIIRLIFIVK